MQTERTEIIRAYELEKGDIFILLGRTYTVRKIKLRVIYYRQFTENHTGNKFQTLSAFSHQRIERIIPETIFNKQ